MFLGETFEPRNGGMEIPYQQSAMLKSTRMGVLVGTSDGEMGNSAIKDNGIMGCEGSSMLIG